MNLRRHTPVRAFTIMELLVVIAIIAVLAGLLFPVIVRAKEDGLKTSALAQMKQLGTALTMYVDDADGKVLPSTNYGVPEDAPERLWTTNLLPLVKDRHIYVAPGSSGAFADSWDKRSLMTIGYNSSSAVDRTKGCNDNQADVDGCVAFKSVASFEKTDPSVMALFTVTPGGPLDQKYLGYEFSPYNGVPQPENPRLTPPMVSDRDLVKENAGMLPAELIKPVYARYMSSGSDDGVTPIVFGDGHVKTYSAKQIMANSAKIIWRLR